MHSLSTIQTQETAFRIGSLQVPGRLFEVQPATYRDRASALGAVTGFLAGLPASDDRPVIWCQLRDHDRLHLHAPGLAAFGLEPSRVIKLTLQSEKDLLWAMEEAASSGAVAGVTGVLWGERLYDFTASKRLKLRAGETGTPVMLLRSHRANGATAADMRLLVSTSTSADQVVDTGKAAFPLIGWPAWTLAIEKSRTSRPGEHHVIWNREALRLDLAADVADRAVPAPAIAAPRLRAVG